MREKGKFSEIPFPVCIFNSYLFLKEQCISNVLFLDHPFAFVRVSYHVKHTKGGDGILKSASHYRPWSYRAVTPCQRRERGQANKLSSWPFSDVSRWWEVAKKVLLLSTSRTYQRKETLTKRANMMAESRVFPCLYVGYIVVYTL